MSEFRQINGEIVQEYDTLITKDPVIGFLVTVEQLSTGQCGVYIYPLEAGWEGADSFSINGEIKVVGVIPAPPGSYVVRGLMPNNIYEELGYEFPGAYHPDWLAELMKKRADYKKE